MFSYISRVKGGFDQTLYQQVLGAANAFKEGDETIGLGAGDDTTRQNARILLSSTKLKDLHEHPLLVDDLQKLIWQTTDQARYEKVQGWTMGELKEFLLTKPEMEIKEIMPGLNSETIGCIPKLMSNEELIRINQKIFNPLPGTKIGAQGYLSARIQPNSPTDNPDDIAWQVFDAFSYATGDLVIGTNPVDSQIESVATVEKALWDVSRPSSCRTSSPGVCSPIRVEVHAFDFRCLYELQKFDRRIRTAYLTSRDNEKGGEESFLSPDPKVAGLWTGGKLLKDYGGSIPAMVKALGGFAWDPEDVELTREALDEAHRLGLKVVVWSWPEKLGTAFDAELVAKMIDWWVDGIITDDPGRLISMLAARGLPVPGRY